MYKKILGLLLLGTMLMPHISANIPNGAIEYNGHYYYVYSNTCSTWEQAKNYCESLGGHLAIIDDSEENTHVYQIMGRLGYSSAYFGISDAGHEGDWRWGDRKRLTWSSWNLGEPNNIAGREHYAMFWAGSAPYEWNDGTFGPHPADTAFICEWDYDISYTSKPGSQEVNVPNEPTATQDNSADVVNASQDAQEVLALVNFERANRGLTPLRFSRELMAASEIRANELTVLFSHTRPNGEPCHSLISKGAYTVGENIAGGSPTPREVVDLWMNSRGHRANILNPDYEELGVGHVYKSNTKYGHYWAQMFKRPMSKAIRR